MRYVPPICLIFIGLGIYLFYELSKFVEKSVQKSSRQRYELESGILANDIIQDTVVELGNNFNDKFLIDTLSLYPFESVSDYDLLFSNVVGKRGLIRVFLAERTDNQAEQDEVSERLNLLYNANISIRSSTPFVDNSTFRWLQMYTYPPFPISSTTVGLIVNSEPSRSFILSEMFRTGKPVIKTNITTGTFEKGIITSTPTSFTGNLTKTAIGQLFDYNEYFEEYVGPFKKSYGSSEIKIRIEGSLVFDTTTTTRKDFQEFKHENLLTIQISNFDDRDETSTFNYVFIPCVIGTILLFLLLFEMDRRRLLAITHSNYSIRFVGDISHEIRTPLNGIQGVSDMMADDEKNNFYVNTIKSCVNSLTYLISNVVENSNLDKGSFKLDLKRVNLSETLLRCVNDSWVTYRNQDNQEVDLYTTVESIPRVCICDGIRVTHIFSNILSNAIIFTKSGSIRVRIWCDSRNKNSFTMKCEVKDTGKGMDQDVQKELFKPFLKLAGNSGTGIGLYVSKRIANLMGGDLSCVSTEIGKGSTFVYTFTAYCAEDSIMEPLVSTIQRSNGEIIPKVDKETNSDKVLIVDDVSTNRLVIENIMNSIGVKFDSCKNGLESTELCQNTHYRTIFMDNMMPVMGGEEATRKIRENSLNTQTPIIFVSANVQPAVIDKCLKCGGNSFLSKPVSKDSIIQALNN